MTAYLDLFTPETWRSFCERGRTITGFRTSQSKIAMHIEPEDEFICYLVGLKRWVGVLRVSSKMYLDKTPHFVDENDPFVVRFKVEPLVALSPEMGIPIDKLWNELNMCSGIDQNAVGVAYKIGVARSLGVIDTSDAALLREKLLEQIVKKVEFPLSSAERKLVGGKRTVALATGSALVEIPPEEEAEDVHVTPDSPLAEERRSIKVQSKLAKIGIEFGFKVWLPANDRVAVLKTLGPDADQHVLSTLPLNADDNTVDTVERIDVLWVKGRTIIRAFEVEDTTAVYSGILRMSDLIALQPQFQIKLHIVAPEERRDKVRQQILRPTFTFMEGGPLARICTFLSFEAVDQLAAKPDLHFMKDAIVEELEEVME